MYWEKSATSVLTALCYAIIEDAPSEEQVHLYSIYTMLVEHGAKMIDRFNSLDLYNKNHLVILLKIPMPQVVLLKVKLVLLCFQFLLLL